MNNSYFSHDSNARNSEKLIKVRMKYGAEGYGVYFMILERLREEHDYMSIKDYNVIAFDLHVDASEVKSIVEDFGLFVFTDDSKYFYSEGFRKRMAIKDKKAKNISEARKKAAKARWGNKADTNAMQMQMQSKTDANAMQSDAKESKEKESKVNQININSAREEFTLKVWPLFPKRQKFEKAFEAYLEGLKGGATEAQIVAGIKDYAAYLRVKNKGDGYTATPDHWLEDKRWLDKYDMTPEQPGPKGKQRAGSFDVQPNTSFNDDDLPF